MAKAKKGPSVLFRAPPAEKMPLEAHSIPPDMTEHLQGKVEEARKSSRWVEAGPAPELHQRRRTQPFVIDEKVWRRIRNIGNKRMLDRDRGAPDASEVLREILALPAVLEWMEENE